MAQAFAYISLLAFPVLVVGCFSFLSPRRAMLSAMLGGWLLLPHFGGHLKFPVLYTKPMFVPATVLLASIAFDWKRWQQFRLRLVDLSILVLCLVPFASALDNNHGAKEAVAATFDTVMTWLAPYLLGRAYLGDARSLREFASALVVSGLLYVPFCLWEARMGPDLHNRFYGFQSWSFDQAMRGGGYRPSVFMQHGLALGMFMATCTLIAYCLWRARVPRTWPGVPWGGAFTVLGVTTVLCRSMGAVVLLAVGIAVLESTRRLQTAALVLAVALTPSVYCAARISGWDAETVVALSRRLGEERADSLEARIRNERRLLERATTRPWLGWGRFGDSLRGEQGFIAVPDSMWIIAFGYSGVAGLIALGILFTLPAILLLRTFPVRHWADPRLAPAVALVVSTLLWAVDNLANHMMSPLFPAMSGALLSFVLTAQEARGQYERTLRSPGQGVVPRWSPRR